MKTAINKVSEYRGFDIFDYSLENDRGTRISIRNFPSFWHEYSFIDENSQRQNFLIDPFNGKNTDQNKGNCQTLKVVIHENSITLKEDSKNFIAKENNSTKTFPQITYTLFEDDSVTIKFDTDSQTDYSELPIYLKNYWIIAKDQLKIKSDDDFNLNRKRVGQTLVLNEVNRKRIPVLQARGPSLKREFNFFTNMDQLLLSVSDLKNSNSILVDRKEPGNVVLELCFQNLFNFEKNKRLIVRNNWITYRIKYH
ncbi:hypothetical protein FCS83_08255 [Oenococcus sp. UCMA 17063]|nr:hypothetical protein [Oenococcus sp. UCMA 17063]